MSDSANLTPDNDAARDAALCRTCGGTGELESGLSAMRCPDCRSQAAPADLRALKKGSDGPDGPQPMTDDERAMAVACHEADAFNAACKVPAGFDAGFRAGWRGALRWANKADAPVHVFSPPNLDNDAAAAADPTPYRDVWCDCGSDGFCLNRARRTGMLRCENCGHALQEATHPAVPPAQPASQVTLNCARCVQNGETAANVAGATCGRCGNATPATSPPTPAASSGLAAEPDDATIERVAVMLSTEFDGTAADFRETFGEDEREQWRESARYAFKAVRIALSEGQQR